MKKLLMMAAVAGLVFASCSNENEEYTAQGNQESEISFAAPVMYKATRAYEGGIGEVNGTTYPVELNFNVFGWKYDGKYNGWASTSRQPWADEFDNTKGTTVTHKLNSWYPATKHTFQDGKNYMFTAYSPAELSGQTIAYDEKGLSITGYTVPELGQQMDIMYANRVYDINVKSNLNVGQNGNTVYDGVNLKFKHALSSVHFNAYVDPDYVAACKQLGYDLKEAFFVKSIKIKGAKNVGNFAEGVAETEVFEYTNKPIWTAQSGSADYVFLDETSNTSTSHQGYAAVPLKQTEITNGGVFSNGKSGMLLPQEFAESVNDVIIEVVWTDDTMVDKTQEIHLKDTQTKSWEPGKKYTYNILFKENLIYFAPQVEDWTDGQAEDITPSI